MGNITSLCDLILSYLLYTRHNHSLSFASTYFYTPQHQQLNEFIVFYIAYYRPEACGSHS
jgi:hypothetical protein